MKTYVETCSVADQFCAAPANLDPPAPARALCFSCGQPVCRQCSSRRKYYNYGRVRLCNTCQTEMDGSNRRVMQRIWRRAGYSGRVPERLIEETCK